MSALVCPYQPSCPGCPRLAEQGTPPRALERLNELAQRSGLPTPEIFGGRRTGFRYRARLAIRGRAAAPKLGIFQSGTHQVVHIPDCLVHHPRINRVAGAVRGALARHGVSTYSDQAHQGFARYLQIVIERESDRAQLVLITNSDSPAGLERAFSELSAELGAGLHSLWWNGNPLHGNAILGPHWCQLSGERFVLDRSGSARVFYPPGAFGQSHLELASKLGERVRSFAESGMRVVEYYAGTGAIGLGLAGVVQSLDLNEIGEGSLEGLRRGVEALPQALRQQVRIHAGTAGSHAGLVGNAELVIADPPRKGLDPELLSALVQHPPARFAYVACDTDSFLRDAERLLSGGALRLELLEAYDLFPHTEHIETLALFSRGR
jgi:tRNA/tmRNA/rRNA uracil-C5-methylase (TrmA/RlmC/RlmD family)